MALPFTIEQFLDVMKNYNEAVFPAQIILFLLAVAAVFFVYKKKEYSSKIVLYILALLWLWVGIAYHFLFFSPINKAAFGFGALFIIQAVMFLVFAVKDKIRFQFSKTLTSYAGIFFIVFALAIYPVLNLFMGHAWPYMPTFGLPCPTVIFTFGMLLLANRVPKYTVIIPLLWALVGLSAAINLGIWEDLMLVVSGIVGTLFILRKK